MKKYRDLIENALYKYLAPQEPHIIFESMGYSVFGKGKRIRPLLLLAACESLGGDLENALPFACAIEMVHAYSLIHDDLPAMDNDDYRRGKLTNHKVYGDAIAILSGDGLLNKAFEVMAAHCCECFSVNNVAAMRQIAESAGVLGMIGGQVVDILSEGKEIDKETLSYIHKNKTGALIKGAMSAGAILSAGIEASDILEKIARSGDFFGLAFQIRDDLLDVQSTQEILGKPVNSDERNNKATYVKLYGIEQSERDYHEYSTKAVTILKDIGFRDNLLTDYIESLLDREY